MILTGKRSQQELRGWLSPPDPSTNHNTACNTQYEGTSTWFFERSTYGSQNYLCCGSTGNVRPSFFELLLCAPLTFPFVAGSGKSVLWYVACLLFPPR